MRAFVAAQVDSLARAGDAGDQRIRELVFVSDHGEDGAVVVAVGVDVQQPRRRRERGRQRRERLLFASLREVRDGFEHRNTLGA